MSAPILVGIDTGGTFTDLIAVVGERILSHKVLSTPEDPGRAVLHGLRELLPDRVPGVITYGSTVATNALLERRGARVVLLTTAGFEDVLAIGRQNRPHLYALEPQRVEPLVAETRRIGVAERMLFDGSVLEALRAPAIRRALNAAARQRPEAIAICLLHSYVNADHEARLAAAVERRFRVPVSVSHRLVPEHREYERCSTTVINAYVAPAMSRHLLRLEADVSPARLRVMQSNGGAVSAETAAREAIRTVLSGPAGGVAGATAVAADLGIERLITFDMGGTSTDVCLVDGSAELRTRWEMGGLPIQVPALDIHTVGAGGGSIARLDSGGALKVGPESAGAVPGPACYGRGTEPTVTDANLLLGRLVPEDFLGGHLPLDRERAVQAFAALGQRLGLETAAAAAGVVRVVNASMERALRAISVERGVDPRGFVLLSFGGAGGQHTCELAAALGIDRVVVPRFPGLLSALGCATAEVQRDYAITVRRKNPGVRELRRLLQPLIDRARCELGREGVPHARQRLELEADVRYAGQSHEIVIPLEEGLPDRFHQRHQQLYGYCDRQRELEVVSLRLIARERRAPLRQPVSDGRGAVREEIRSARRPPQRVWGETRWHSAPVVRRESIAAGGRIAGPALIVELSSTTYVAPGWQAQLVARGHLQLTRSRRRGAP